MKEGLYLDLRMPKGNAVNVFIDKDLYLNEHVDLVFPRIDDFVQLVKFKGQGCLMFCVKLTDKNVFVQVIII
jgi:hypothetical protein